jgi:hypothetical protein
MKQSKKLIILLLIPILLLTACFKNADDTPTETPPVMTGPLVTETPSPTPAPAPTPTRTPRPTPTPKPTPEPDTTLPIEIEEINFELIDDDYRLNIKTQYPDPSIYEERSTGSKLAADILNDTGLYYDWIKDISVEAPATDENMLSYGLTTIMEVTNNDSWYLSVYVDYYIYTGGAHGNVERISYNYSNDGYRTIRFEDLLNDGITAADVEAEINRQMKVITEEWGALPFFNESISFDEMSKLPRFYIQNGKMVIYFQTYEIAAYAYGIPMFEMPPEIFSY